MLTAADVAGLTAMFMDTQTDTALILYRYNDGSTLYDTIAAQSVQVAYPARQARPGGVVGAEQTLADVAFYKESPFNVQVSDWFEIDGHKGGRITRVATDPITGIIVADGFYDQGTA